MLQATVVNAGQLTEMLSTIDWLKPSWDLFIILFFVVASFVYGISLGRDRILVILISIYMALAVVKYVPFITEFDANISINENFALKVSVFLGMFVLLFFLVSQSALVRTLGASSSQGKWWQVFIFSLLHAGLLLSVTLSFIPNDVSGWLSPLTKTLFVSDHAKAVWVILPIVTMIFLGGGKDKD